VDTCEKALQYLNGIFSTVPGLLVALGLGTAYAVLMLIAIEIGGLGVAVGGIHFGRQPKTPSAASIAGKRGVRDAIVFAEWGRERIRSGGGCGGEAIGVERFRGR
jgi:hypothetical protein